MPLTDFLEALPEDKREAYKAEISKAVIIASDVDAEKFAESNEFLRKANQKYRDPKIQEFKDKFLKEDVPKLLEEERKKGAKQPWELEIEKLKAENEQAKRESALEKQKSRAVAKAAELGIPASLVDKFIGLTDEETDNGLKFLADTIVPFKESAVKAALEKIGSQPAPRGGVVTADDFSKLSQTELMAYAKRGPAEEKQVLEWVSKRK